MAYLQTVSYEAWMDDQSGNVAPSALDDLIIKEEVQALRTYAAEHGIDVEDIDPDVAAHIIGL